MSDRSHGEVLERLERMERQLRIWRQGALAALGVAMLAVAGAMAAPSAQDLSAKTLRIIDDAGRDRIVLSANPLHADMIFLDPTGKSRLTLDVAKDRNPVLIFSNQAGKECNRLVLGLEDEGHPSLMLYDSNGRKRLALGIPKDGGPVMRVLDENEKLKMRFP